MLGLKLNHVSHVVKVAPVCWMGALCHWVRIEIITNADSCTRNKHQGQGQLITSHNNRGCNPLAIIFKSTTPDENFGSGSYLRRITLWPFRSTGYCRCLCLSISPPVCPSVHFSLSARWLITDLSWDHTIGTTYVAWDILSWYWKWESWSWLSRLFWSFWLSILGNWACPCDNFWWIKLK